jgi:predicted nucleic acid-binding protein
VSRIAVDTSVLVAAMQSWHEAHESAVEALGRALEDPPVVVPLHALVETYSVLTRMPKPLRLAPEKVFSLLDRTLRDKSEVASLDGAAAFDLLAALRDREVAGGSVYDVLIAETALRAGARRLLTLNRAHFERVAPAGLEILEPV